MRGLYRNAGDINVHKTRIMSMAFGYLTDSRFDAISVLGVSIWQILSADGELQTTSHLVALMDLSKMQRRALQLNAVTMISAVNVKLPISSPAISAVT